MRHLRICKMMPCCNTEKNPKKRISMGSSEKRSREN